MGGGIERLTGHVPSESEGRDRAGARGGRGGEWDDGGAGVESFDGWLIVFMPPPGVGGGNEQSDRARPERKRGSRPGRRERGKGWGMGR